MKMVWNTGGVLVAVALLAGCSERSPTTAPLAKPAVLATSGFIGDRPYTWSLKCSGDYSSGASWYWTGGGVAITGSGVSASCFPGSSVTGTGTRPAVADGFHACVNGTCQTWTFDPASAFKTQLKGTSYYQSQSCIWYSKNDCKATGILSVES